MRSQAELERARAIMASAIVLKGKAGNQETHNQMEAVFDVLEWACGDNPEFDALLNDYEKLIHMAIEIGFEPLIKAMKN